MTEVQKKLEQDECEHIVASPCDIPPKHYITDFESIQRMGRINLSPKLRDELNDLREDYLSSRRDASLRERLSSTRVEQKKDIERAIDSVDFLCKFLFGNNLTFGKAHGRFSEELIELYFSKNDSNGAGVRAAYKQAGLSNDEIEKLIHDAELRGHTTVVNFRRLNEDLRLCAVALRKSVEYLKIEGENDEGGRKDDLVTNEFLKGLRKIFDSGHGKRGAFERFCEAVVETLPQEERPALPKTVGSIGKRASRAFQKPKETKEKKSRLEMGTKMIEDRETGIIRFRQTIVGIFPRGSNSLKKKRKTK